ncbi:MAG: metallophosphoesterase, partial [Roseimicrobium sp.]
MTLLRTLRGHEVTITSLAFDPQGETLASGGHDRMVKVWSVENGELLRTFEKQNTQINCIAFDFLGKILATASEDKTIRLWNPKDGNLLHTLEAQRSGLLSIAFDPQGMMLLCGDFAGTTSLWDAHSGSILWAYANGGDPVTSLAFSPDGATFATASWARAVHLFDVKSRTLLHTLKGHDGSIIWSLAFDPKGEILASAGSDNTVKVWKAKSGELLRTLEGHTSDVEVIAFSPDGHLLATKSNDQTIRLWSCETWMTVATIANPSKTLGWNTSALAFHPTLPLLAACGSEWSASKAEPSRLVRVWELDVDLLTKAHVEPVVTYTSAKVVLVGESNVGKSYLAHRIATGASPEQGTIVSTHGMKFWPLEPAQTPSTPALPVETLFGQGTPSDKYVRRDIVMWDMGGQEEYRLVHQLFLHDTTVALVLLDPTRGTAAFKEVEAWNKSLDKQLGGRAAVKLLVGSKMDVPSEMMDRQGLERLLKECGFAAYCETSAVTERGIHELCEELAKAINWDHLSKTSRPELFQAIRDDIERRRKSGGVVVLFDDLNRELHADTAAAAHPLIQHEVAMSADAEAGKRALDAVCSQLAQQGIIARAKTSGGQSALVLRIEEVERYAGSLILAAKRNQHDRGVPALELRAIGQELFHFPQIAEKGRLPRADEKAVVECTVQLMLEHGICFEHEGLLIFPSLFAAASSTSGENLPHAVSLYYDFAGAIDNIYAALVAWLVLAKKFGKVRLWSDRAEFEMPDSGLCGLRKVGRPGGFAHVDVYFENEISEQKQREFVSFVEDHLSRNGIEIREQIVVPCPKGYVFDAETLLMCIAEGDKEVLCPRCKCSHSFAEGAAKSRERDPNITENTWALRTEIARQRNIVSAEVVKTLGVAEEAASSTRPIRLLHLSDLHFTKDTPVDARLQWLLDDLRHQGGLAIKELDYLVISGDFTDKGKVEGFEKAYEFVSKLTHALGLSAGRCIFVPGNHDVCDVREAYDWREDASELPADEWVQQGDVILARNRDRYPLRLRHFSDSFYHKFLQRPYPLKFAEQSFSIPFWETGIQFITLNSCYQIDQFYRRRAGIHPEAVANAIKKAQDQEVEARKTGLLAKGAPLLRIAVWHHAVVGSEQMKDTDFLGNLQKGGVELALHGDVHQMMRDQVGYLHDKGIHVVGSGSFGAQAKDRPESIPRLYNVLEIARDLKS